MVTQHSNCGFRSKAVAIWHRLHHRARMRLIEYYPEAAGNVRTISSLNSSPERLFLIRSRPRSGRARDGALTTRR